jgi:hypothetical protein
MATTTNYGWTTPDDTALVKDGAAAIRTLGSSVDTTTKNLNPSTTLGDIEYRSSTANTNTRLGIGTTGQILTVAAGVPSWATPSSGGMTLLSTTALSGSSTTISSISGSYTDLQIVGIGISLSATDDLFYRFNGVTTNSYANKRYRLIGGAVSGGDDTNTSSSFFAAMGTGTTYDQIGNFITNIPRYAASEFHPIYTTAKGYLSSTSNSIFTHTAGAADISAAITSITILTTGATFSTGTVYLYGVK